MSDWAIAPPLDIARIEAVHTVNLLSVPQIPAARSLFEVSKKLRKGDQG